MGVSDILSFPPIVIDLVFRISNYFSVSTRISGRTQENATQVIHDSWGFSPPFQEFGVHSNASDVTLTLGALFRISSIAQNI